MTHLRFEIVDLPTETQRLTEGEVLATCLQACRDRASNGDSNAQRELVVLRVDYLNWAYARQSVARLDHGGKRDD